jgi:tryptophan-rich sensory protein
MLGLSWALSTAGSENLYSNLMYSLVVVCLVMWIVVYGTLKKRVDAIYVLLCGLSVIIAAFLQGNLWSRFFLVPLLCWTLFAMLLNTADVQSRRP